MNGYIEKKKYTLVDGDEMHAQFPGSWEQPTMEQRKALNTGDYVKFGITGFGEAHFNGRRVQAEGIWAIIREITGVGFKVEINNRLVFSEHHGLAYEDIIDIGIENIIGFTDNSGADDVGSVVEQYLRTQ